ncbi:MULTISPECIES: DUF350 domain-containing protein [unclassified Colwellia]|jgi:hypothetical protein|uniref:DUF350 domain-containing protein n=1 Tax=unclassified Colwellia TaxID=196834 RepID=UPI0015F68B08|nr:MULTISPECIES: DUF350 domain-containing protein [unclassified Colwellia]MBA6337325.1 DUF350 domain-containing protein [Colwellia sp. BRX8-7]MBA6347610.1 DUF350 domain-containing protein [Colwellia sp. BRX8-9]MBA6351620.1 DUF350 domain-containing protein [Colwellia sp. BRX9-1]MBA6356559.1 DUF350 domain-containing protein [Colwellia sp. BRX8-3]MBA6359345.1 DUF350 domain-containing protein [Colwellia sp. BRX8-6]
MNTFFEITALNQDLLIYLVIDISIAIVLLGAMRFISGLSAKVNSTQELAQKDNFAFGISVAGSVAALGIVLTGAISGENAPSYWMEFVGMFAYGTLGLILIKIGRVIHDKLSLQHINKTQEILNENLTIGIVDAAGAIATAIIIRAVLLWVHGLDVDTFIAIIAGFIISQAILLLVTRLKERQYAKNNQGDCLQEAFTRGQTAIAIRYAGQLISTALAVTAASHFLTYSPETLFYNLISWFVFAVVMTLLVAILTAIAKRIVLWGINLVEEVDQQQNIGVACVEMATSISIALILTALMS